MIIPSSLEYTRGVLVVDYGVPMFTVNGVMFGGYSDHEYGHHLQQEERGDKTYYATVALPAVVGNIVQGFGYMRTGNRILDYYSLPWEADATRRAKELQQ